MSRFFFSPRVQSLAALLIIVGSWLAADDSVGAAEPASKLPDVVVTAPASGEFVGPYAQPRWSARGRFSSETDVYVLPPWQGVFDSDYQLTVPKHGTATHLFTQELELGLPYRFQIAYENNIEVVKGRSQVTIETIEARWALADWGKIPLNPTLFGEYKFGVGRQRIGDAVEEGEESSGAFANSSRIPDSYEVRLLLSEQFGKHVQWALNLFHEQETAEERETETGFSQAISYSLKEETLRAGIEMQFVRRTDRDHRSQPEYEFDLGPSLAWKPTKRTRLDLAALFGTTEDSPALKFFAVFSIEFGSSPEREAEAPVSTRNR